MSESGQSRHSHDVRGLVRCLLNCGQRTLGGRSSASRENAYFSIHPCNVRQWRDSYNSLIFVIRREGAT